MKTAEWLVASEVILEKWLSLLTVSAESEAASLRHCFHLSVHTEVVQVVNLVLSLGLPSHA